ncbi:hypothetical protein N7528_008878 [Penicillium herquei]|nr:hypothetical protein N7528_008878 [Penicillium herquei]
MNPPLRTCTGCHHTYEESQFRPLRGSNLTGLTLRCLNCRTYHLSTNRRIRAFARHERAVILGILAEHVAAAAATTDTAATSTANTSAEQPTLRPLPTELTCVGCCRRKPLSEFQPVRSTGRITSQCTGCRQRKSRSGRRCRRQA